FMPMALRGPAARTKRDEIDAELGEPDRIAERALLAPGKRGGKGRRGDAAHTRGHARRSEPPLRRLIGLSHAVPSWSAICRGQSGQTDSALAWLALSLRLASIWAIASSTAADKKRARGG